MFLRSRDGRLVTEKSFKIKQIILEFGPLLLLPNGKLQKELSIFAVELNFWNDSGVV